jgi:hypothetical protein
LNGHRSHTSASLQDIDGASGQQGDGRKRDERLEHHEDLGPAREHGNVGGREGGRGVEGEEEVIDEAGRPVLFAHGAFGDGVEGHLGEEEGSVGVGALELAHAGTAGVEAPVPRGEDEDVGDPERGGGEEQVAGRLAVRGQGGDEQAERPDHVERDDAVGSVGEDVGEAFVARAACDLDGDQKGDNDREQQPVGADGEGFREGKAESANGEQSKRAGPAGLGAGGRLAGRIFWRTHGSKSQILRQRLARRGAPNFAQDDNSLLLEITEIVQNFGVGPAIFGHADELAADDAAAVDDVGLGWAGRIEGVIGGICDVVDGEEARQVVIDKVLAVGRLVGIEGDGEDDDLGHLALELDEGGELLGAGSAPARPEIEDNGLAAVVAEGDGLRTVANDDGGRLFTDLGGVAGAVAGAQPRAQGAEDSQQSAGYKARRAAGRLWVLARIRGRLEHVPIIKKSQKPVR